MLARYGQQTFLCVLYGEKVRGVAYMFILMQKSLTSLFSLYLIANLLGTIYIDIYEDALVSA